MTTAEPIDWSRLTDPFPPEDVEWRVAQAGEKNGRIWARVLAYITARAIQERLDEVFGVDGWRNEYRAGPSGGVIARIYFRDDDGEWCWREDGAENTDIEAVKGGLSGAMKRAGAALGIGRYLYNLPEGWANVHEQGSHSGKTKDGTWFKWDPPKLPDWALPGGAGRPNGQTHADPDTGEIDPLAEHRDKIMGSLKRAREGGHLTDSEYITASTDVAEGDESDLERVVRWLKDKASAQETNEAVAASVAADEDELGFD